MTDFYIFLAGALCAAIGGELFVRGVVGIALWARISQGIIAATFAAFATSSPELSVSITSAMAGTPQIALGDSIGSNVVNIALILAIALLIAPIHCSRDALKRDFPVTIAVPIFIAALAFDGTLSMIDGVILLSIFSVWLVLMLIDAKKQRSAAGEVLGEKKHGRSIIESLIGLIFLVAAGNLIVNGATGIAASYGIDPFVIGSTLVALGTSAPELATVVIARLRGHDEIGLGTILGSNIFNGLFVVGVASTINPIPIAWADVSTGLVFGLITTALILPLKGGVVGRARGAVLLITYGLYVFLLIHKT
jgi:cation:H+ antiporter